MKVAIIGAGLLGRLLAWRLNESNPQVEITLIDQYDRDYVGIGLVAAAMVAPYTEAVNTEEITQHLGASSYDLWSTWLAEFEQKTGQAIAYNKKGTLVVSHAQDDPDWQRFLIKAKAVVVDGQMQQLDKQGVDALEPEIARTFSKGLYFPNEGVVDNQTLYPALNEYFEQAGNITWMENTQVTEITNDGKIAGIDGDFDYVFDCRGNGAKDDLKEFRSVRGEVARVYAPEVKFSRAVRLMHPRFPLYIAPRDNHEYIIGATQIESDVDTNVTIRSALELLSALYSLHQGFGEAQILEFMVGLRPTFANNLPRVEVDNKLIRMNGLYRHGYLFAPILVKDLLHHLDNEKAEISFPQFIFDTADS